MFLGWWGTISFIVTPFFLLNNVARYLFCLPMPPVAPDATSPVLTDDAFERIKPHSTELFSSINRGEDFESVAAQIAAEAGVTPGQVVLFVQAVIREHSDG
jgi:hypothetical protein